MGNAVMSTLDSSVRCACCETSRPPDLKSAGAKPETDNILKLSVKERKDGKANVTPLTTDANEDKVLEEALAAEQNKKRAHELRQQHALSLAESVMRTAKTPESRLGLIFGVCDEDRSGQLDDKEFYRAGRIFFKANCARSRGREYTPAKHAKIFRLMVLGAEEFSAWTQKSEAAATEVSRIKESLDPHSDEFEKALTEAEAREEAALGEADITTLLCTKQQFTDGMCEVMQAKSLDPETFQTACQEIFEELLQEREDAEADHSIVQQWLEIIQTGCD